jgi:hypothetical protein
MIPCKSRLAGDSGGLTHCSVLIASKPALTGSNFTPDKFD